MNDDIVDRFIKKGYSEGLKEGIKEGIIGAASILRNNGYSESDIVSDLVKEFNISEKEALEYVRSVTDRF